jgi:hypothetical protein
MQKLLLVWVYNKEKLTHSRFMEKIESYLKTHQEYLNEMSETDPKRYKHERLRKALNKYNLNHKYMFTFQAQEAQIRNCLGIEPTTQILTRFNKTRKNKNQIFQNTTNDIDGGLFSPIKNLLGNHGGLNKQSRKRMIILYLNNSGELYPKIDSYSIT